jgi:hypothetical protein
MIPASEVSGPFDELNACALLTMSLQVVVT